MKRTRSFICGVSCFPGGPNCNGYCHNPSIKSPGTYEEQVPQCLFAHTAVDPGPSGYVPFISINRVDGQPDSFEVTVRDPRAEGGKSAAIVLTREQLRTMAQQLIQELHY